MSDFAFFTKTKQNKNIHKYRPTWSSWAFHFTEWTHILVNILNYDMSRKVEV